jgi:hypothetical protein
MEDLQRSFNQLMSSSSSNLRNDANAGGNGDASESLYEEVDVLSPVKADASSYLSGVGDLMISSGASAAASNCQRRRVSDFLSPSGASSAASRRASSYNSSNNSSKPKSMPALQHLDLTDDIVEEVIDDDDDELEEEVVLDPTEVEYYEEEELEIEEIELDDDLYEELVLPESSAAKTLDGASNPPVASTTAGPRPASSNTAPTFDDLEDDDDDEEDEREPLPSREEVAEAITYIVRQEKVVEYGLMTKSQVDEMNDLPLEEMMEIMKHFEICDNNNATIQWDLVLAMVNPDYSPDAAAVHDDLEDDEEDDQAQPLSASSSRNNVPAHHHHRRRRSSGASSSQRSDGDGDVDEVTEIHAFATSAPNNNDAEYMMGSSCYSLEVADPSETGVVSNLTAADYAADQSAAGFGDDDDDDDDEYQEETLQGSIVSMDPLIRASYTKSMVELQMSRPARRGKDDDNDGGK